MGDTFNNKLKNLFKKINAIIYDSKGWDLSKNINKEVNIILAKYKVGQ